MSLSQSLGNVGVSVLNKLGAPSEVTSQLNFDDVQIQGAQLKLWRIDVIKVWENTDSFTFAIKLWCNVSPSGNVCAQADAAKVPNALGIPKDRTFNISGPCSFSFDFFTPQEIIVLKERAASLVVDPTIEFGQNGAPSLFLKAENPGPNDGIGFSLSTANVWSNTSKAMVDVINLSGLAIQGLRLAGKGIAGQVAAPVKVFVPRSIPPVAAPVAPQTSVVRPPVISTQFSFTPNY